MAASRPIPIAALLLCAGATVAAQPSRSQVLLNPDAPQLNRRAPERLQVDLDTTKGVIVLEVVRGWAPLGVDRFYNLLIRPEEAS